MLKFIIPLMICVIMFSWGEILVYSLFIMFIFLLFKPNMMSNTLINFELDFFTWSLVMLSFWVVSLSIMSSMKNKTSNKMSLLYLATMMTLLMFLTLTFTISNSMVFYLLFEACLIPILIMILGWGYQPERSQAGVYMLFYTIFGSLPLLIIILQYSNSTGSNYMFSMLSPFTGFMSAACLSAAFLVKFPMYGVHLWLLKAHVEAPVAGSMILAGVLLKLGGYGLIRMLNLLDYSYTLMKELIISVSVWGGVLVSINCLRYTDMKLLIASSSVVHMSTCVAALFIMTEWSVKGCLLMMLAHGVCSSGLFSIANIAYERTNSRSMLVTKGLLNLTPMMSLWWFLILAANMAAPPSINLVGEIMLLTSLVSWNNIMILPLLLLSFFSASYSVYLYSLSQHGTFNKMKSTLLYNNCLEYLVMLLHWLPLNFFVLAIMFMV
uniref:NADH-ubiquinone oxidoreductase chain 4 n=1 Tax=Hyalella franciscae TaxID=2759777 RepID=A0A7T8V7J5_9CRUS|nr:NADH dehydrogenase subunit 4 [Hyalella franciscae]